MCHVITLQAKIHTINTHTPVPRTAVPINKNQLRDEKQKTTLRTPRERKHILYFYILILFKSLKNLAFTFHCLHSANTH